MSDGVCSWSPALACTIGQTCTDYTRTDTAGDERSLARCVNGDQTGALCDPRSDDQRCSQNNVQYCYGSGDRGTWQLSQQCTTDQTCTENTIVDAYGSASVQGLCGNDGNQTGTYCHPDRDNQRCFQNDVQYCYGSGDRGTWQLSQQCTTEQTCTENIVVNDYGVDSVQGLCVNDADQTGEYCDPQVDSQRCFQNNVQYCYGSGDRGTWQLSQQCTTEQSCSENIVVDDFAGASVVGLCENPDGTNRMCRPETDNQRCFLRDLQYCYGSGNQGTWQLSEHCGPEGVCLMSTETNAYGDAITVGECVTP
jgi:hypothetical protein